MNRFKLWLETIKVSHSVFALPFALLGAFLAAGGPPGWRVLLWTVVAAVAARTAAMTFNRLVDRRLDAANPRTAQRALATGAIPAWEAWAVVAVAVAVFVFACASLNPLTLRVAPFVLAVTLGYSLTKRFTSLAHLVLGVALGLAPLGGWVATSGSLEGYPVPLSLAVVFWVAGFDVVYACLDEAYDRGAGLHSIPARLGRPAALILARVFHVLAFAGFAWTGWRFGLGLPYAIGLVAAGAALAYEHAIVSPRDLSRIQVSFLTMNGLVSVVLFATAWLSLWVRG
ncbi:MAG TPA: UbiA-like polyprenyltransferase [Thermoanaerobaculia bacterium]|nr:UbiA-like polyprenyltransferase [Thermoanaerobaculia bacterium]